MTDFVSIRRRAESLQENSGLGTPEHAISQDVLELLECLQKERRAFERANTCYTQSFLSLDLIRKAIREVERRFEMEGALISNVMKSTGRHDPEAVAMNGAFAGPVPHE